MTYRSAVSVGIKDNASSSIVQSVSSAIEAVYISKWDARSQKPYLHFVYITTQEPLAKTTRDAIKYDGNPSDACCNQCSRLILGEGYASKSDYTPEKAPLFNASGDNTNFIYEVTGNINDDLMQDFNTCFTSGGGVAIQERMRRLTDAGCDLQFVSSATATAARNLTMSGGIEMPAILGNMLKFYYFTNGAKSKEAALSSAIKHVAQENSANYQFDDAPAFYYHKVRNLLYDMFTGMRLGSAWDGKCCVNGGYIVVGADGSVLAHHSCIADDFKDYLLSKLRFDSPSASRHHYMTIYKENGKYYLKLNLQIRFL